MACQCSGAPPAECGNDVVEAGESCEFDDDCLANHICEACECAYVPPVCGDEEVVPGEQCDIPDTQACAWYQQCVECDCVGDPPPKCGNDEVEGNEDCDDGNLDNGDGCSEDCTLEVVKAGSIIFTEIMADPETVSDAAGEWFEIYNREKFPIELGGWGVKAAGGYEVAVANGSDLVIQPGQYLVFGLNGDLQTNGGVPVDYVYDNLSLLNAGESLTIHEPNDPESIDGVGYSKIDFPNHKGHSISLHPQFLDGELNDEAGNWCLSTTKLQKEDTGTPGEPNDPCYGYCGDGDIDQDAGEVCDDGPLNSNAKPDACRLDCSLPECGDGMQDSDEECDNGDSNSDSLPNACRTDCKQAWCGDGVKDFGEACDDGAQNSDSEADACRKDCSLPECGDGVTDAGEECDDGNTANGDGCDESCKIEVAPPACGDGNVDPGEACDDGNTLDGDGCRLLRCRSPLRRDEPKGSRHRSRCRW